jgi:hypothetical protein
MSLPSRRAGDDAGRKRAPALRLKFRRSWRAALGVVHASASHFRSEHLVRLSELWTSSSMRVNVCVALCFNSRVFGGA